MKFIDDLRKHPICFNGSADRFDFVAAPLIDRAIVVDVTAVAQQLIESHTQLPMGAFRVVLVPTVDVDEELRALENAISGADRSQ